MECGANSSNKLHKEHLIEGGGDTHTHKVRGTAAQLAMGMDGITVDVVRNHKQKIKYALQQKVHVTNAIRKDTGRGCVKQRQ